MTLRNWIHSQVMAQLARFLYNWVDKQPEPRGAVLCGEAGCRLSNEPETLVGIDVIYLSPDLAAYRPPHMTIVEGVPTLVVEILSPNDTQEGIFEKVNCYLDAGVPLTWIIEPYFKTVTIYSPGQKPTFLTEEDELSGDPLLSGFRVAVAELFR